MNKMIAIGFVVNPFCLTIQYLSIENEKQLFEAKFLAGRLSKMSNFI